MAYEPTLIAPYGSGLSQYYKPFLIGNDAFTELDNCYSWRGQIHKREGSTVLGRLSAWKTITSITPGANTSINIPAHGLSTGDMVWIEGVTGTISTLINSQSFYVSVTDPNNFIILNLNTQAAVNSTSLTYIAGGSIFLPILGLLTFILTATGNELLVAMTPKQAWVYNTTSQLFQNISFDTASAAILWTGTKDNFFQFSNYATVMWTTNNVDSIRFWNGSFTAGWANHIPVLNGGGTTLDKSLIVLPYKGRLVVLNTVESGTNFAQRARWSQLGTPFVANAPTGFSNDATAWRDDIPGKGGYIDADTSERIVSAQIIQDTLIVGFQFSTWRLRYTGNEILPFVWERVDTQYGCEATFSAIPFDDSVLMISRRGIVGASFNNVQRIDLQIPDFVNRFETGSIGEGLQRIQGVRDFQKRLVYWTYGDQDGNHQTPNKILCFNYQDNTWSTFSQSFTSLGSYKLTQDGTWQTWTSIWATDNSAWNTPLEQANTIIIVAGSQDSTIWNIMVPSVTQDNGVNYNFTITTNLINPYFKQGKRVRLGYYDLYVTSTDAGAITLKNYTDDDDQDPWIIKTVNLADLVQNSKYVRVFLGMIARQHQITLTLSDEQLASASIGSSDFNLQGIIFHTRDGGRIKR